MANVEEPTTISRLSSAGRMSQASGGRASKVRMSSDGRASAAGYEEERPALIQNSLDKRIAEAFDVFDHSGTHTVDVREVGTIIRSLGCVPSEAEIQEIIVNVEDQETSGSVPLEKFLPHVAGVISEYKMQPASAEELLKAFQTLDKENKGYLTREFLDKALTEEGEPFSPDEVEEMMAIAVDPDSGHINYEYYINQIMVKVEPNIYDLIPPPPEEEQTRVLGAGLL